MNFLSARLAIAGVLVSWLDKHPGAAEAIKLYAPQRSVREIELLKQRPTSTPTKVPPRIHISRPTPSYVVSRPQGPHHTQDLTRLAPARALPRNSQRSPSTWDPSPSLPLLPREPNGSDTLMLHRTVKGPLGQSLRKNHIFS